MQLLDPDTRADLEMQLDEDLRIITKRYSFYVSCVRESLMRQGVSVGNLRTHLLGTTAFNHDEQKRTLVSSHEEELERAEDLNRIFAILLIHYSSFLNYEIFQEMVDKYKVDKNQEELDYPKHLEAYVNKHKISEFVTINPLLTKETDETSKELVLKIDIEQTSKLAKLKNIKFSMARILGLKSAALRLKGIEEGCVVATFLIPTPVAEIAFNKCTEFTKEQVKQFQALSVLYLKCNGFLFDFNDTADGGQKDEEHGAQKKLTPAQASWNTDTRYSHTN